MGGEDMRPDLVGSRGVLLKSIGWTEWNHDPEATGRIRLDGFGF